MSGPRTVDEILALYAAHGSERYGEDVDMATHALQCATLAMRDGASDELVAAALLHDVGHLVAGLQGRDDVDFTVDDDAHEAVGARVLAPLFGPAVATPVALHVVAKRWRCTTDPAYHDRLSPASQQTLVAQGGTLTDDERARFERHPGFTDALSLREWDDTGKQPGLSLPSLTSFAPLLERVSHAFAATRATA